MKHGADVAKSLINIDSNAISWIPSESINWGSINWGQLIGVN